MIPAPFHSPEPTILLGTTSPAGGAVPLGWKTAGNGPDAGARQCPDACEPCGFARVVGTLVPPPGPKDCSNIGPVEAIHLWHPIQGPDPFLPFHHRP